MDGPASGTGNPYRLRMTSSHTATRRAFILPGIVLASILLVAACGDDTPAATTTTSATSSTTTTIPPTAIEQVMAAVDAIGPRYAYSSFYMVGGEDGEFGRVDGWVYDGVQYGDSTEGSSRYEFVSSIDGDWARTNGGPWNSYGEGVPLNDLASQFMSPTSAEVVSSGTDGVVIDAVYDGAAFGSAELGDLTARITIVDGVMTAGVIEVDNGDGTTTAYTLTFDAGADLMPIAVPPTADNPRALEVLPLTPFASADPIIGTYVRGVADNGWHIGAITPMPTGGYLWTNQGGASWSLTWDDDEGVLVTGDTNPYRSEENSGADVFDVNFDSTGVTGFRFLDELYSKVASQPFGAITVDQIVGTYVTGSDGATGTLSIAADARAPELNGLPAPGGFTWTDAAGATVTVTWDPITGRLEPEGDGDAIALVLGTFPDGSLGVMALEYQGETLLHMG